MSNCSQKFQSDCRGFLMIEVMVTMIILAVGLLGAAALQARSMQYAYVSAQRTIATIQANDLVERLWASSCSLPAGLGAITQLWRNQWQGDARFTSWIGEVGVDNTIANSPVYDITIKWTDRRLGASSSSEHTFSYSVAVPRLSCKI